MSRTIQEIQMFIERRKIQEAELKLSAETVKLDTAIIACHSARIIECDVILQFINGN